MRTVSQPICVRKQEAVCRSGGPRQGALVRLSLASKTRKRGRHGQPEGSPGLNISRNFDVFRGSLTQEKALDQTDLMPPKRKARKSAAAIDLTEEASPQEKKQKVALTAIAKEFVCPITQELPIKPVTAEDGKIYEEKAIREWFSKKDGAPTSPSTGAVIGTKLFPAPQARNTIEALVKSGAIDGEIAEAWQKKLEQESEVAVTRADAEGGDGKSMYRLGRWYENGECGLAKDDVQARAWHERSAAARDPMGMARFGEFLLAGRGGSAERPLGLVLVTEAATLGSDLAAWRLGESFLTGDDGLPKDPARARYWLKKAADSECEISQIADAGKAHVAKLLEELDAEQVLKEHFRKLGGAGD